MYNEKKTHVYNLQKVTVCISYFSQKTGSLHGNF
jgi:hypothetical protein